MGGKMWRHVARYGFSSGKSSPGKAGKRSNRGIKVGVRETDKEERWSKPTASSSRCRNFLNSKSINFLKILS